MPSIGHHVTSIFAAPIHGCSYQCWDFLVPMNITAPSLQVAFPPFENHTESLAFLLDITSRSASGSGQSSLFKSDLNTTSSFSISARYCNPSSAHENATAVQVLTHGLGFDKDYWEIGGPNNANNYIQAATDAGYATLSYDRLGTGHSTYPDPYNIVQGPTELAVLAYLTEVLRRGAIHPDLSTPKTVVHVGHSFGSALTNALAASAPALTDGIVLTGYSTNNTWQSQWLASTLFHLAKDDQPKRFGHLNSGYVTWGGVGGNQYGFFHYPYYNNSVLVTAEKTKYPFTVGEILTQPVLPTAAPKFKNAALVISGAYDQIFCGGDCSGVLNQTVAKFPNATKFETYMQPNTGHALNLHYNATGTYRVIMDFIKANM